MRRSRQHDAACYPGFSLGVDSMPIAWYARHATPPAATFITATSQGVRALTGPTLESLSPNCTRVVFNSTFDTEPDTCEDGSPLFINSVAFVNIARPHTHMQYEWEKTPRTSPVVRAVLRAELHHSLCVSTSACLRTVRFSTTFTSTQYSSYF